jgi:hypothetical protein
MAAIWDDDGTTSSSDGQYFRAGGRAGPGSAVNAKYGIDPGVVLYTHVSGRYGPFHTRVIAATMSEAPYVLDGLHHHAHQTDLRIAEHYTDTAGATDHVFGLCHLLGFRFAPRIKDLKDRKVYAIEKPSTYPLLEPLIGDAIEQAAITSQWTELMRLKASIEVGSVMPSVILRKLAAAGNALSRALRALVRRRGAIGDQFRSGALGVLACREACSVVHWSLLIEQTTHMLGVPPKSSGAATNRCVVSRLTKSVAPGLFRPALGQACRARSAGLTSASLGRARRGARCILLAANLTRAG